MAGGAIGDLGDFGPDWRGSRGVPFGLIELGHRVRRAVGPVVLLLAFALSLVTGAGLFVAKASAQVLKPDWVVDIVDTGYDPTPVGGTVVYHITVSNDDLPTSTAPANTLRLTIPASGVFTAGSGTITGCTPVPATGPKTVVCTVPPLKGGDEVTLDASVKATAMGIITVTANVPTLSIDRVPANNTVRQSTTITNGADIKLELTGPQTVPAGSFADYTFTATNLGPGTATNLLLTMPVPDGLGNITPPAGCTLSGTQYSCTIAGPLAPNAKVTRTFRGQIGAASNSTLTVVGSIASKTPPDPVNSNDTATFDTAVTEGSDVAITKARAPQTALHVGDTVTFTLAASYTGDSPNGLEIYDSIPSNYTISSVTPSADSTWGCSFSGQAVNCSRASGLSSGINVSLGSIVIVTKVNAASTGVVRNTATISSTGPFDPVLSNNTANDGGTIIDDPTADLRANKSGPNFPSLVVVGQTYNFRISTTNLGNSAFTGTVIMTDSLPTGLEVTGYQFDDATGWNCTPAATASSPVTGPASIECRRDYTAAAPLAVNAATPAVTLVTRVTQTGTLRNSMTVTTENPNFRDPDLINNTTHTDNGSQPSGVSADIGVFKRAGKASLPAGDIQTFDIEVVNFSSNVSTGIVLTDDLTNLINNAEGATASGLVSVETVANAATGLSCSTSVLSATSRKLSCDIASLPKCTQGTDCPVVTVQVRPGGSAGNRSNTANTYSRDVADSNLANNTSQADYQINSRADVIISKNASPLDPAAGQNLTYVITAKTVGDGRSSAENVTITDALPDNVTFVSASPSSGSCSTKPSSGATTDGTNNNVVCNLGTIFNGSQQTVTIIVRPNTATRGTTLPNTATVTTTTEGDDPTNNTAEADVTVEDPVVDLLVNKSDSVDPAGLGSTTVYTLKVTNNGPSAAENVVVTDTLPAEHLVFTSYTVPADGSCGTVPNAGDVGGSLKCGFPRIESGQSRTITVTMTGVSKGVTENTVSVTSDEVKLDFDPNLNNNTDAETTTVKVRVDAEVASKKASKDPVAPREPFTFEIILRNNTGTGLGEAENVSLADALPAGMELTASPTSVITSGTATQSGCSGAAGGTSFTCNFGTMSNGGAIAISVPVKIVTASAPPQTFKNTATATTDSLDINPANNSNSGNVSTVGASIAGLVFRDFNDNGTPNGADSGIEGVTMTLEGSAPDGSSILLTTRTDGDGEYLFASLPNGTYRITRGAVTEPNLTNGIVTPGTAGGTASGPVEIQSINLPAGSVATGYNFALVPQSGIGIVKSVKAGPTVNPDGTFNVTFGVVISNSSAEALDDMVVSDVLQGVAPLFGTYTPAAPAEPGTYTLSAPPTGDCGGLNAAFNGASDTALAQGFTLPAQWDCTIEVSLAVRATTPLPPLVNGGRYWNKANVSGTGRESGQKPSTGSNEVPVAPDLPELSLTKQMIGSTDMDGNGFVSLNDILNYRIVATSTGSTPLTNVVVTDDRITPNTVTCAVLQPGEQCILEGTTTVTIADVQNGKVVNHAQADTDQTGPLTATTTTPVHRVVDKYTLTKTALVNTVKRGEKVPYEIRAVDVPVNPARIVDVMPPGFAYVPGSGVVNGKRTEPEVNGRRLTFDAITPDAKGAIAIKLTLVATAAVATGDAVNRAQLVDPRNGEVIATAHARVTVLVEAAFDCGGIIGKVFDDRNRNGYQDDGEPGLPAVRIATVRGLLVTSDAQGRFHIACADLPDPDIGSNFLMKLDARTLPTGYRVTTENPRRVRLTAGKLVKLNFGAALSRLVTLDLNDKVFEAGAAELKPKWKAGLAQLIAALEAEPSSLRITYLGKGGELSAARLKMVAEACRALWQARGPPYVLDIETRLVSASGEGQE